MIDYFKYHFSILVTWDKYNGHVPNMDIYCYYFSDIGSYFLTKKKPATMQVYRSCILSHLHIK